MIVRYCHPRLVIAEVMSLVQTLLGASTLKSCPCRLGAIGS
jgi:hypothetical protein